MRTSTIKYFFCTFFCVVGLSASAQEAQPSSEPVKENAPENQADDEKEMDAIERSFNQTPPISTWEGASEASPTPFRLEHHGLFRFRPDMMYRLHLNTHTRVQGVTVGTSKVLPPLTENNINNVGSFASETGSQDDNLLAGVNMRFRYNPTLHVVSGLRIGLQLNVLDNLVLGSTPEFDPQTPGQSWVSFSNGQQPPQAGVNGETESISLKQAFGEWDSPVGLVRIGRQAFDWGMGLSASDGQGIDDDFGDFVDRVMLKSRILGTSIYALTFGDYVAPGRASNDVGAMFGQSHGLAEEKDVQQYGFGLISSPQTPGAKAARYHRLEKAHEVVVDWGLLYVFRKETLDTLVNGAEILGLSNEDFVWQRRDAMLHSSSLWLRVEHVPQLGKRFFFELEAALSAGSLDGSNSCVGATGASVDCLDQQSGAQDILQYGAAMKSFYSTQSNQLTVGLDAGIASGQSSSDSKIGTFHFDRDFRVDQILFREVLGGISNAVYVKPYIQWDFFAEQDFDLGLRGDLQGAWAVDASSTPGGASDLGYELDASVFYRDGNRFYAGFAAGFFLPGAALNLVEGYLGGSVNKEASWALRVHGHLTWTF